MKTRNIAGYLLAAAWCMTANVTSATEVSLKHGDWTLNAELELADGKTLSDGAIVITHGALAHRDMESITAFRQLLGERGYNTLAINLSLGLDHRYGMYDCQVPHRHRNEDAAKEIGAWVDWLAEQGAPRVVVLGHSRGGAQTALYAAKQEVPPLKAVVLMAPATADNNSAETYVRRYGKPLPPLVEKAEALTTTARGEAMLEQIGLLTCSETTATAESFLSYYGQAARVDTPALIPDIAVPTLVIVAGRDSVVVGLEGKIAPHLDETSVRMVIVDEADHMFRDLHADEAIDAIDAFLQSVLD